jgi:exportin-7
VRVLLSSGGGCLDEMLDAEEQLSEQLESLPYLVRFQYEKSSQFIISLLDPLLEGYQAATQHTGNSVTHCSRQCLALVDFWCVCVGGGVRGEQRGH